MKYLLNLTIIVAITITTAFVCCDSKAVAAEKITLAPNKVTLNAQLTYRTVLPVYERHAEAYFTVIDYVVYAPNRVKFHHIETEQPITIKQDITFFEQATLFNDKLQSWLN